MSSVRLSHYIAFTICANGILSEEYRQPFRSIAIPPNSHVLSTRHLTPWPWSLPNNAAFTPLTVNDEGSTFTVFAPTNDQIPDDLSSFSDQ